jgi:hypothetical protein
MPVPGVLVGAAPGTVNGPLTAATRTRFPRAGTWVHPLPRVVVLQTSRVQLGLHLLLKLDHLNFGRLTSHLHLLLSVFLELCLNKVMDVFLAHDSSPTEVTACLGVAVAAWFEPQGVTTLRATRAEAHGCCAFAAWMAARMIFTGTSGNALRTLLRSGSTVWERIQSNTLPRSLTDWLQYAIDGLIHLG